MTTLSPAEQTRVLMQTVREVLKTDVSPMVMQEVEQMVRDALPPIIERAVRSEINRPWRWQFRIWRLELALRWRR